MTSLREDFGRDISKGTGNVMQLFLRGMQVLGAVDQVHTRRAALESDKAYIPKSAITMSLVMSFVLYRMFSGLRSLDFDSQSRIGYVGSLDTDRWTISCAWRYLTPSRTLLITDLA